MIPFSLCSNDSIKPVERREEMLIICYNKGTNWWQRTQSSVWSHCFHSLWGAELRQDEQMQLVYVDKHVLCDKRSSAVVREGPNHFTFFLLLIAQTVSNAQDFKLLQTSSCLRIEVQLTHFSREMFLLLSKTQVSAENALKPTWRTSYFLLPHNLILRIKSRVTSISLRVLVK